MTEVLPPTVAPEEGQEERGISGAEVTAIVALGIGLTVLALDEASKRFAIGHARTEANKYIVSMDIQGLEADESAYLQAHLATSWLGTPVNNAEDVKAVYRGLEEEEQLLKDQD